VSAAKGHVRLRIRPGVPMVRIADQGGRLQDFYGEKLLPPWAIHSDEQTKHMLDHGLVELADDAGNATDPGRLIECVSALISAGVAPGMGRPRAAELVRAAGGRYSNETLSGALKLFNSDWKYPEPIGGYL